MKTVAKVGLSVCLLAAAGMMYGCGDGDYTTQQTGKVVKGPVRGAKVKFAGFDNYSTRSGQDGTFTLQHPGAAIITSEGRYFDLANDVEQDAPAMKAPAGARNVTPLTTAVANAATPAAAAALIATFEKLGVSYDEPLDAVNAAGTNRAAIAINEIIGSMMADPAISAGSLTNFINQLALRIDAATTINPSNPSTLASIVNNAAIAASVTTPAAEILADVAALNPNQSLPQTTGTTGGTGGATGGTGTGF